MEAHVPDKLKISVRFPRVLFGSEEYTAIVEVTNVAEKALSDISVDPQLLPGTPLSARDNPSYSELDQLEEEKRNLIRELEEQIARAYERERMRRLSVTERVLIAYARTPDIIAAMLTRTRPRTFPIPYWAKEACRIKEWDDLIRLESTIMAKEPAESFLAKAFQINKQKLSKALTRIAETRNSSVNQIALSDSITIQPGESIAFPFRYRAPNLYRQKAYDCQFNISYSDPQRQTLGNYSSSETITFFASSFAVPFGAALGSLAGFFVKAVFITQMDWWSKPFCAYLLGSVLLALIVAFATARSSDTKKVFTVEDFVGGIVVGSLSGLFSERILEYLGTMIPK
jgi:hypothetical protein